MPHFVSILNRNQAAAVHLIAPSRTGPVAKSKGTRRKRRLHRHGQPRGRRRSLRSVPPPAEPAGHRRRIEQADDVLAVIARDRDEFIEDPEFLFLQASSIPRREHSLQQILTGSCADRACYRALLASATVLADFVGQRPPSVIESASQCGAEMMPAAVAVAVLVDRRRVRETRGGGRREEWIHSFRTAESNTSTVPSSRILMLAVLRSRPWLPCRHFLKHLSFCRNRARRLALLRQPRMTPAQRNAPIECESARPIDDLRLLGNLDGMLELVCHGSNQPIARGVRVHDDSDVTLVA
jgi:hypothetical protein